MYQVRLQFQLHSGIATDLKDDDVILVINNKDGQTAKIQSHDRHRRCHNESKAIAIPLPGILPRFHPKENVPTTINFLGAEIKGITVILSERIEMVTQSP